MHILYHVLACPIARDEAEKYSFLYSQIIGHSAQYMMCLLNGADSYTKENSYSIHTVRLFITKH